MARNRKVLLVCADRLGVVLRKRLLQKNMQVVMSAMSGAEIMRLCRRLEPDVLLIECNDYRDLKIIKQVSALCTVIIIASQGAAALEKELYCAGTYAVLTTPVSPTALVTLIDDLTLEKGDRS